MSPCEDLHVSSIVEMCRVAVEARVFPLLDMSAIPSRHLNPVRKRLLRMGYAVRLERAPYEFQKGGNEMLRITPPP